MARLVYGLNQSLDGYIDHTSFDPPPDLFKHFIGEAEEQTGAIYGRVMYETMRYWDDDQADWGPDEHRYAAAWRRQHKWVVSRTLETVGANATLIQDDIEGAIRRIKDEQEGDIEIAGPMLAAEATRLGLIDEYRIYLHPAVVGSGKTYFNDVRPTLRFESSELVATGVLKLTYVPA